MAKSTTITRLTIELPTDVAEQARATAARSRRPLEELLAEWIGRAVAEPPVESLSDAEVLALCDRQLDVAAQEELSELLDGNRERALSPAEQARLDELMRAYRRALVRKSQALLIAVARGLKPPLE